MKRALPEIIPRAALARPRLSRPPYSYEELVSILQELREQKAQVSDRISHLSNQYDDFNLIQRQLLDSAFQQTTAPMEDILKRRHAEKESEKVIDDRIDYFKIRLAKWHNQRNRFTRLFDFHALAPAKYLSRSQEGQAISATCQSMFQAFRQINGVFTPQVRGIET